MSESVGKMASGAWLADAAQADIAAQVTDTHWLARLAPDTTCGPKQSYRLIVPTLNTSLILGQHDFGRQLGFPGISGQTEGFVFLSAAMSTTLQAEDQVLVQSLGSRLFLLAADHASLGSASTTCISGAKGVVIYGGAGPTPTATPRHGEALPNEQLVDLTEVSAAVGEALHIAEVAAATATTIGAGLGAGGAGDLAVAGMQAFAALTSIPLNKRTVTVHGQQGLTLTSGTSAVTAAPVTAAMIGGGQAEMIAIGKVEMAATLAIVLGFGKAALEGGAVAEVLSARKVEIASRRGNVEVLADSIEIGKPAGHGVQAPTATVHAAASKEVRLDVGADKSAVASIQLQAEPRKIHCEAKEIVLQPTEKLHCSAGSWVIEASTTGISVGRASDSQAAPKRPRILISDKRIAVQFSDQESLSMKSGKVHFKVGGRVFKLTSDGFGLE